MRPPNPVTYACLADFPAYDFASAVPMKVLNMKSQREESSAVIIVPPKLYLDTNHAVNIANLRRRRAKSESTRDAYAFIDDCLRHGIVGLIHGVESRLEWVDGKATRESACEIAAVFDSAKLSYFLDVDRFVWTAELLNECKLGRPELTVPIIPILQRRVPGESIESALGILAEDVPGYWDLVVTNENDRRQKPPKVVPLGMAREETQDPNKIGRAHV